jgi:hypothetical protein
MAQRPPPRVMRIVGTSSPIAWPEAIRRLLLVGGIGLARDYGERRRMKNGLFPIDDSIA